MAFSLKTWSYFCLIWNWFWIFDLFKRRFSRAFFTHLTIFIWNFIFKSTFITRPAFYKFFLFLLIFFIFFIFSVLSTVFTFLGGKIIFKSTRFTDPYFLLFWLETHCAFFIIHIIFKCTISTFPNIWILNVFLIRILNWSLKIIVLFFFFHVLLIWNWWNLWILFLKGIILMNLLIWNLIFLLKIIFFFNFEICHLFVDLLSWLKLFYVCRIILIIYCIASVSTRIIDFFA